jgi:hypothetical protein
MSIYLFICNHNLNVLKMRARAPDEFPERDWRAWMQVLGATRGSKMPRMLCVRGLYLWHSVGNPHMNVPNLPYRDAGVALSNFLQQIG